MAGGGYIVPEELEDAVRTGLEIVGQPVTVNLTPKMSDWMDGSVKPTIVGVYERDLWGPLRKLQPPGTWWQSFSYWDGSAWRMSRATVASAADSIHVSSEQCRRWRGLAEDPSRGTGGTS